MSTKDPHIALIDAQEALHEIKLALRNALAKVQKKVAAGYKLTEEDKTVIKMIRQTAIDATRRVQDKLLEELEGHGLQTPDLEH